MSSRSQSCAALLVFVVSIFVVSGAIGAQNSTAPAGGGDVVCKIGDVNITEAELLAEIDEMIQRAGNQVRPGTAPQLKVFLYARALDNLQEKVLLKKVAEAKKIEVTPKDIEDRYDNFVKQFPSEEQMKQTLETYGLTPETLKDRMKVDVLYMKVLETEVKEVPEATDEEVQKFFDENKDQMKQEEQVKASHILIKVDATASEEEKAKAKAKLEGVRKDILEKKITFADAAKQNSDCPSKDRGGDLGHFGRGDMVPEFDQVAFTVKPGEMSDIVETQFGYHIIQVAEHQEAKDAVLADMKDKIKKYMKQEKTQKAQQDFVQKLKDEAKIETLIDQKAWEAKYAPQQEPVEAGTIQISPEDLKP